MLYIQRLAPMMDSCDDLRHFTLEVPRLALQEPMLLYGILALAGRYDALHHNIAPGLETTSHNSQCLELMIEALAQPPETWGAELLAAVVISRSYEECDFETDLNHHHLTGIRNLLDHKAVSLLAMKGGLAEAACWVHLRQVVYAYLVHRRPIDSRLELFEELSMFKRNDDVAIANHMVYSFACVLRCFSSPEEPTQLEPRDQWGLRENEVRTWYEAKPTSFEPIYTAQSGFDERCDFPMMSMVSAASGKFPT